MGDPAGFGLRAHRTVALDGVGGKMWRLTVTGDLGIEDTMSLSPMNVQRRFASEVETASRRLRHRE
jgi:hypothetical protein